MADQYVAFYEEYGRFPDTPAEFAGYLGLDDESDWNSIKPLTAVSALLWERYFDHALEESRKDPSFASYSCREVYLSLLYNLVGEWNRAPDMNRAMLFFGRSLPSAPAVLKRLRSSAQDFFGEMISAGQSTGEIADRPVVNYQYKKWCWWGLLFTLYFWHKDSSEMHEQTDVAIERAAHFIFDLLNPNALDSSIEFFSFLFKQGMKK